MKLILLSIVASVGFFCCSNNVKQDPPETQKIVCNYLFYCKPDSTKKEFTWQKMIGLRKKKSGPNTFTWQGDSITLDFGSGKPSHFMKKKLPKAEEAKLPRTLLNGKFKLKGIYEQDDMKNSGFYFVFYVNGNNILEQIHEMSIGFLADITYFSEKPINEFEEAGVVFPYRNSIKF